MMVRAEIVNQDRPGINPARIESSTKLRRGCGLGWQAVEPPKSMNFHICWW